MNPTFPVKPFRPYPLRPCRVVRKTEAPPSLLQLLPSSPAIPPITTPPILQGNPISTPLTGSASMTQIWRNLFKPFPSTIPKENPTITIPAYHMQLKSLGLDLGASQNHMVCFLVRREVVGMQLELNYFQMMGKPQEIISLVTPMKIEDIYALNQQRNWMDWERFLVPNPCNSSALPLVSSRPLPNLNMKVIFWNIRGACTDRFLPHALELVHSHRPTIFIVLETKASDERAQFIQRRLNYDNLRTVQPLGKRGGLWMFWKDSVDLVDFVPNTPHYFHALFHFSPDQPDMLLTGMYAPSIPRDRKLLWKSFRDN